MKILKIGVLGGIGPEATSYFYYELIKKLKNSGKILKNADYPQIIINSINAPELTSFTVSDEELKPYIDGVKELVLHQPDFIVMACNTIHLYRDMLIEKSNYNNILSLADIVKEQLPKEDAQICILGSPSTVECGLYNFEGYSYSNPSKEDLAAIGMVVNSYNATGEIEKNKAILKKIIKTQADKGASVFVTACTEVSELLYDHNKHTMIHTLDIFIEKVFQLIVDTIDN